MAGKLTEEQRAEIVRRYKAGESSRQIARTLGVSKQTVLYWAEAAGLQLRPHSWTKRATVDTTEEQLIISRYLAGEGIRSIARSFSRSDKKVSQILTDAGVALRNWKSAWRASHPLEIDQISQNRWWEMYGAPGSGYPSVNELARRFNVDQGTIARRLRENGIALRSMSEQIRLEIATKRHPGFPKRKPDGRIPEHLAACSFKPGHRPKRAVIPKIRVQCVCAWCGETVERYRSRVKPDKFYACNYSHLALANGWKKWHPNEPRPLILDRLREKVEAKRRELKAHPPFADLPLTAEYLENLGAPLGANEVEITEVLLEEWASS